MSLTDDQIRQLRAEFEGRPFDGSGMVPSEWARLFADEIVTASPKVAEDLVHELRNALVPMLSGIERGDEGGLARAYRCGLRFEALANAIRDALRDQENRGRPA